MQTPPAAGIEREKAVSVSGKLPAGRANSVCFAKKERQTKRFDALLLGAEDGT